MKKIFIGIVIGFVLAFSVSVFAAPVELYNEIRGEVIRLFDADKNINVKIGAEAGTGANVGGTIILYNHTNKDAESFDRVAIGTLKKDDSGTLQLMNTNGIINTWLTTKEGYIGNSRIATEQWLENNGYIKKDDVQKMIDEALKAAKLEK